MTILKLNTSDQYLKNAMFYNMDIALPVLKLFIIIQISKYLYLYHLGYTYM